MIEFISALGLLAQILGPVAAGILLAVFFLKRFLGWADRRGWIMYTGNVPTWGTLGNAFLEVQACLEPAKAHIIEVKNQEEDKKEQEDSGDPEHPDDGVPPEGSTSA
ncbi:MAG TPA: hypothetical protein VN428_15470 [Bryobacteraceae bacterium]|nr:hypothetical protein [Bryobacteraceae bacterium]